MALLGSGVPSEVGLRLLLCPLGSNVVIRTACCSVGVVLPIYSTFKAIETKDEDQQQKWLLYWTVYGSFTIAETVTDKLINWCPYYYHLKFAFLVWLQLPTVDGANQLYMHYMRPFLQKHQSRLDQFMNFTYGEMVKFASNHESEIQIARSLIVKIISAVNHIFKEINHPGQSQASSPAIEGPPPQGETSESGDDE